MSNFEMLDIDLRAITEDSKEFTLVLDDRYFKALDDAEIQHGTVTTTVRISKMPSEQFALSFSIEATSLFRVTFVWTIWSNLLRGNAVTS